MWYHATMHAQNNYVHGWPYMNVNCSKYQHFLLSFYRQQYKFILTISKLIHFSTKPHESLLPSLYENLKIQVFSEWGNVRLLLMFGTAAQTTPSISQSILGWPSCTVFCSNLMHTKCLKILGQFDLHPSFPLQYSLILKINIQFANNVYFHINS